jgi:hypothetical protein
MADAYRKSHALLMCGSKPKKLNEIEPRPGNDWKKLVLCNERGGLLDPDNIRHRAFLPLLKASGLHFGGDSKPNRCPPPLNPKT